MTAGRKTTKPGKKASKRAAKKQTPTEAPPKVKVPKRTKAPDVDPHSQLHEGDPDKHLVDAAEKGRDAASVKEIVAGLSEETVRQYGTLSKREMAFVEAYLELRAATPAAIKAGYSKTYAHSHAGQLINKPIIRAVIQEIDRVNLAALRITGEWVIQRLAEEAQFAFEGGTRVKALIALGDVHEIFPAKAVKHSVDSEAMQALRSLMNGIDGAGTGLPPPTKGADGQPG